MRKLRSCIASFLFLNNKKNLHCFVVIVFLMNCEILKETHIAKTFQIYLFMNFELKK